MNNQPNFMKKQFLLATVIATVAILTLGNNIAWAVPTTHESTGSLSTSGSVSVVVTGGTLSTVATISGTTTSAVSLTITGTTDVVFAPPTSGTTSLSVTIPSSTVITASGGTTFDSTAIVATGTTVSTWVPSTQTVTSAVEFGAPNVSLHFSDPIIIRIPVSWYTGSTISILVRHFGMSLFGTDSLTNDPNAVCTNGIPNTLSSTATVTGGLATIYSCAASTFAAVTTTSSSPSSTVTSGGGGGGGGSSVGTSGIVTYTTPANTSTVTTTPVKKTTKKIIVKKTPVKKSTTTTTVTQTEESVEATPVVKKPVKTLTKEDQILAKNLYTNSSRVNLYLAADTKAKFIGYLTKNVKVSVLEENGDWIKVTTATFSGWAKRSLFRLPSEKEAEKILRDAEKVIPYVLYTNKGRVNVRLAGDTKAKFLGYFGNNTKVEVIGDGIEWLNVTTKKLTGWSKKADFRDPTENEDTSIQIAK